MSVLVAGVATLLFTQMLLAQSMEGELRICVRDPGGRPVPAKVVLVSRTVQFQTEAQSDSTGRTRFTRLPYGIYNVSATHSGFGEFAEPVEIRSGIPRQLDVTLQVGQVSTQLTVRGDSPLIDPAQSGLTTHAGRGQLDEALGTTLGRSTIDVVASMPGWLLEANAILHPRGSEYDTQYVIDGMALYDNRSLPFAPPVENGEFESVNVRTSAIPAEHGRRLGGVIALETRRDGPLGNNSTASFQAGGYDTYLGSFTHGYRGERTAASLGLHGGHTSRYLDPPTSENFTNKATAEGANLRLDQDLGSRDRVSFYLRSNRALFQVPNDAEQQEAGQRQDRANSETAGQIHFQHLFSSTALGYVRGMARDLSAKLWSNPLSTPQWVEQDRGFLEGAVVGGIQLERGRHSLKIGGDVRVNNLRESFRAAEPDELPELDLDFHQSRRSTETSGFVQEHLRLGNLALSAGLRFDYYNLLQRDSALSPRAAFSYHIRRAGIQIRASYDRVFQPPPTENLLLSSAAAGLGVDEVEDYLQVPASRAHFFEVGLSKSLRNELRLDVSHYWRRFRNFMEDDVFLNTGVSFPITFDRARVEGTEVRLELPRWRGLSSFVSYSNMTGTATSPVTGGLFIEGGEADELRGTVQRFPISQDQRNTLAAQARFEPRRSLWLAAGARYGSGLPVELAEDEDGGQQPPIDPAIAEKVDFERGRIKPNFSLDLSLGFLAWQSERGSLTVQFDVRNATGSLNLINYTGLFSGTAIGPGRMASFQIRTRF